MIFSACRKCINGNDCDKMMSECGPDNNYAAFRHKNKDNKFIGETMKEKVEVDFREMNEDYEALDNVLMDAYDAASSGKP